MIQGSSQQFILSQGAHHQKDPKTLLKEKLQELYANTPPAIKNIREVANQYFPEIATEDDTTLHNRCSFDLKIQTRSSTLTPEQLIILKNSLYEKGGNGLTEDKTISAEALLEMIKTELHVCMKEADVIAQCKTWKIFIAQNPLPNQSLQLPIIRVSQRSFSQKLSNEGNLSRLKSRLKVLHPHIPPTIEEVKKVASELFPKMASSINDEKNHNRFCNLCSFRLEILTYSDKNLTPEQLKLLKTKLEEKGGYGLTEKNPISLRALFETIEKELHVCMERGDVKSLSEKHKWKIFIEKSSSNKLTVDLLEKAISQVGTNCIALKDHLHNQFQIDISYPNLQGYAARHQLEVHDASTLKAKDIDKQYESALVEHYKGKNLATSLEIQEFIHRTYGERPSLSYAEKLRQLIAKPTPHPIIQQSQTPAPQDEPLEARAPLPPFLSTATFTTLLSTLDNKASELTYKPKEAYALFTNRLIAHVKSIYPEAMTASQLKALKKKLEGSTPTLKTVQKAARTVLGGNLLPLDHIQDLCSFVWGIETKISSPKASLTDMQKSVMQKIYSIFYKISGEIGDKTLNKEKVKTLRKWMGKTLSTQASDRNLKTICKCLCPLKKKQTLHEEELSEIKAYCQYSLRNSKILDGFMRRLGIKLTSENESEPSSQIIIRLCQTHDIPIEPTSEQKYFLTEACKNLDLEEFPITQEKIRKMVKDLFDISIPPIEGVSKFCEETLTLTSQKLYKNTKNTLPKSSSKLSKVDLKKVKSHLVLSQNSHTPSIAEVETALRNTHKELYADGQNPPSHQEIRNFCVFVWDIDVTPELEEGETLSSELQKFTLLSQPAKVS